MENNNNKIINNENNNTLNNENNNDLNINLEEEINKLKDEIDILNKEIIDNKIRFKAEIENINKRNLIEIEKIKRFSNENLMLELIIIIDNLERAIFHYDKNNIESLIEGIKLTLKLFIDIVNKFGLKQIDEINVPFNPDIYQAVILEYTKDIDPNYVIEILQKGYSLNGRLIRPAMSKVSTNKNEK